MSEKRQWLTVAVMISAYTCAVLTQAKEFVPATYGATAGAAQWSLAFDADGQVTVSRDGETAVQGTYDVSGGELEVIDQKGPMACPPDQTGRYKWSLDDETLTLTKVSDDCVGRSRAFTELAWTRKEQASAHLLLQGGARTPPMA